MKWRPGKGKWSVHEVVCHCADSETNPTNHAGWVTGIRIGNGVFVGRNTILSCKNGDIVLDEDANVVVAGGWQVILLAVGSKGSLRLRLRARGRAGRRGPGPRYWIGDPRPAV